MEQYPDLTLDQVNRPNPNDNNSRSPEPGTYLPLTAGQLTNVYVSAIMSGGHICIQVRSEILDQIILAISMVVVSGHFEILVKIYAKRPKYAFLNKNIPSGT